MTPEAVVFDCDGVLVDSEPHSRRSWTDVLDRLGHPASAADVAACTGLGFLPTRTALSRLAPLPAPEELWPELVAALRRSFEEHGLRRFEDSMTVLEDVVAAGIPHAVVSASPRERLDLTLLAGGLAGRFVVSVAGDEVEQGKPAPDGYLAALAALDAAPGVSVAVEDSPMGVRSARAAGMRVIAVAREAGSRPELEATGVPVVARLEPGHVGL